MIELRLLGSVDLRGSDGETLRSVLSQPKRVALLAYLAVAKPNGFHRRDKLLGLFWPESDQERGRGALRKAVHRLRQSLGDEVIVGRGDDEVGLAEGALWCDTVALEEALEAGKPEESLEIYRGDLLEGFYIADAPEFERWLESERKRLRRLASDAAWALAEHAEGEGNAVEACRYAQRAAGFAPDDEGTLRRLLELLDRVGDRAWAVREYEAFAGRLRDEYEAEPSPETQALIAAIREREVAATAARSYERTVDQAPEPPADSPAPALETSRPRQDAEPRLASVLRVLATYALVSLAVLVAVHVVTLQFGLPDWFFPSAVVVLLTCLPIIVGTALLQGSASSARRSDLEVKWPSAAGRWLTWRKAVGVAVAAFAVLGLAVSGYMAMRVMGIGPWGTLIGKGVLEERDVIVVADFEDHTNDSLSLPVTEAIRVDLGQSEVVRVAERNHIGRLLKRMGRDPDAPLSYELAREVAIREGLKAVVSGEITVLGSNYLLSAWLVAAETEEELYVLRETAEGLDSILPAIDRLSSRLRERIGESLKTIRRGTPLSNRWTASLQALRLYTESERAILSGHYQRALDLVNRALELDTAFASAYGLRSVTLSNLDIEPGQRIKDSLKGYELRHRLPLDERYRREAGYHATVTNDLEKQIDALNALLDLDSLSWLGSMNQLGLLYYWSRDYARAEDWFRRRLAIDSLAGTSWRNLAQCLFDQGKFDEAWETLRRWEAKTPENPLVPRVRALFASAQSEYDAARAHRSGRTQLQSESLLRQADFKQDMGRLAQVQGRLAEAEAYYSDVMALYEEADRSIKYLLAGIELAGLHLWYVADTARALETMAVALAMHPLDSIEPLGRPYLPLAGFYAFSGEPERARELLAEWETFYPPEWRRGFREANGRREWGTVALAERRSEEALIDLRFAQERVQCPICSLPLLGRAQELAGQSDSALTMYELYVTTPYSMRTLAGTSPSDGFDPYWLPVVYERLGDLYEQRADTTNAIRYYGKLVELWKDADPELQPRVEAARRAIEALSPDI